MLLLVVFVLCLAFVAEMHVHQGLLPEPVPGGETTESVKTETTGLGGLHNVGSSTEERPEESDTTALPTETDPLSMETVSPPTTMEPSETTTPECEETQPTATATEESRDSDELPIVPNV